MRYLNECEFDIFDDLNSVENELKNMNVSLGFDFYDYDLCNEWYPTHHQPLRHQIILFVVKIIFGILLKCVFGNKMNENKKENEIRLELKLEFKNINVNINCSVYPYPPPYLTHASHHGTLLKSREYLVFFLNHLDAVNDNEMGFVYGENENVKIKKCQMEFW